MIGYLLIDMQRAIAEAERTGDYETPAAKAAYSEYYRRHVVGCDPWPDYVQLAMSPEMVGECYYVMQGASEFVVTDKMKDFGIRADLHKIRVPTLMLSGTNDEATLLVAKEGYDLISGCEWTLVQGALISAMPLIQKNTWRLWRASSLGLTKGVAGWSTDESSGRSATMYARGGALAPLLRCGGRLRHARSDSVDLVQEILLSVHIELSVNALDVCFRRVGCYAQRFRHVRCVSSACENGKHLLFSRGESSSL
uniref:hypothetical protein n=1 Tax=Gordonibacter sp. An230 TaxID=1965592 RepID=UPI001EF73E7F|nr:hypothetical protein [Gordonibacter sp. An230]